MARDLKLSIDGGSAGAQKALEEAALAAEAAAKAANHLGDEFRKASRDAAELDAKLAETTAAAAVLAREFSKTNDAGLKKQLDTQRKAASELKNVRRDIVGDTEKIAKDAAKLAASAAKDFEKLTAEVEQSSKSFAGLGGAVEGGLGSPLGLGLAGIAAGPALATAGGLTAGLAGFGAAGLGAYGAILGDPDKFGAAWSAQTDHVKREFIDASAPFEGPLLTAISSVGPIVDSWGIGKTLAAASKYIDPIVAGLEGAGSGLVRGFSDLVVKGGPAVTALSYGLKQLGEAGGQALSSIASGAEGGAEALHDVVTALSFVVEGFGYVTEGAEKAYAFIQDHPIEAGIATGGLSIGASIWTNLLGNVSDAQAGLGHIIPGTNAAIQQQAADLAALSQQLGAATISTDTLAGQMSDKLLGSLLAGDHAALSWDESLTQLSAAFKDNGKSIDEHTAKGQANREAALSAVAANVQVYDTQIAAGAAASDAAAAYDANTAALEANLHKAGLTAAQIQGLIGKYEAVPDNVNTDIAVNGLTEAINSLAALIREINGIHDKSVTIGVTTVYHVVGRPNVGEGGTQLVRPGSANLHGGIRRALTGMIVPPRDPGTVLFGEPGTGGEAFIPLGNSISDSGAAALAGTVGNAHNFDVVSRSTRIPPGLFTGGGGGGGGRQRVELVVSGAGGAGLEAILAQWLARASRNGDVQVYSQALV